MSMRLSQIVPSYSFLYRKGGVGEDDTATGEEGVLASIAAVNAKRNRKIEENPTPIHSSDAARKGPYCISNDGTFYDKNFKVANPPQAFELKYSDLLKHSPQPHSFSSYYDYEEALIEWKDKVTSLLAQSRVVLPRVEQKIVQQVSPKQEGSESANKEDEKSTEKEIWSTQLVLEEPNPELFNTYEEYKAALSRWAIVCTQIPTLPPHASQISQNQLLDRCTNVMQSSLPKGTKLYLHN